MAGSPIAARAASICSTASPSDAPAARLNDTVAAGNWPMWLTISGAARVSTRAMPESGVCRPSEVATWMRPMASGPSWKRPSTSSTTRYWLA